MMRLAEVKKKILDGLRTIKAPPGEVEFTYWLHRTVGEEGVLALLKHDIEIGEEGVNDWLAEIMVESGRYEGNGKGWVKIRKETAPCPSQAI